MLYALKVGTVPCWSITAVQILVEVATTRMQCMRAEEEKVSVCKSICHSLAGGFAQRKCFAWKDQLVGCCFGSRLTVIISAKAGGVDIILPWQQTVLEGLLGTRRPQAPHC